MVDSATPYLNKALELNYNDPQVHLYLGYLALFYKWDFNTAMDEFNLAGQLSPSDINNFPIVPLLVLGHFKEALIKSTVGYSVDPGSFVVAKGVSHYFMNENEKALELCHEALKTDRGNIFGTGQLCLYLHLYDDAIRISEEWLENNKPLRTPVALGYLAIAFYHTQNEDKTNLLLNELKTKSAKSAIGSPAYYSAMTYAQMQKSDLAFEWLERAFNNHEMEMVWLKQEHEFQPIHADPRWQKMLDKVGFPD